jgi:hypothetical protein
MNLAFIFARRQVGATCILAFAILAACTSASPSGEDPDAGNGDSGLPQCGATQRCVGYPSFGDWVCLESCGGAGDCPAGKTCESVSGCCTGTACSAVSAHVCVASDAGTGGDAQNDGNGDGGFPQCTAAQRCVGYPSFGDWVCLTSCSGVGAADCPSGQTCKSVSGCCSGTACTAKSEFVCVAP